MEKTTRQTQTWSGEFGKEYTDRNIYTQDDMDKMYIGFIGVSRTELNKRFLANIDKSARILEVGTNIGTQLKILQGMGFQNLYGIELQKYAVEKAKSNTEYINIIQGSAFDIPYKDNYFDLVFTSGVLIHISPEDINTAIKEIVRCTREYIWGYEYFAEEHTGVEYRSKQGLLWKANFVKLFLEQFPDLEVVKEDRLPYVERNDTDTMYLLRKNK